METPEIAKQASEQNPDELLYSLNDLNAATAKLREENEQLKESTQRLIKAVHTKWLTGIPEIKTVDDVIRGMRKVADDMQRLAHQQPSATTSMRCQSIKKYRGEKVQCEDELGHDTAHYHLNMWWPNKECK